LFVDTLEIYGSEEKKTVRIGESARSVHPAIYALRYFSKP